MDTQTLNQLIQRRNQLTQELERLRGRKEQAQRNLSELESECREKNIDPDKIEETLKELWARYQRRVPELEAKISRCADALAQYTKGTR